MRTKSELDSLGTSSSMLTGTARQELVSNTSSGTICSPIWNDYARLIDLTVSKVIRPIFFSN